MTFEAAIRTWNSSPDDPKAAWKSSNTDTTGTLTTIGSGYTNTYSAMSGTEHPAAELCRNYDGGGFDDWFLPSKDELNIMSAQKEIIDMSYSEPVNAYFLSSSQYDGVNCLMQNFSISNPTQFKKLPILLVY